MGQPDFVSGLAFLRISFLDPQSQSYSLSEGSQQLPKGDIQPSAAVQPLSRLSGSGEPEAQQPVSTFDFPLNRRYDQAFSWVQCYSPITHPIGPSTIL